MKRLLFALIVIFFSSTVQGANPPVGLRCDLMEHTERVYINGHLSQLTLEQADNIVEEYQTAHLASRNPSFSWAMEDDRFDIKQSAFHIQLSADKEFKTKIWDSGKVESTTPQVRYAGEELTPLTIYYWRVRVWDNHDEKSEWSEAKSFKTAEELKEYSSGYYPLTRSRQGYTKSREIDSVTTFYDFGKAAFSQIELTVDSKSKDERLTIRFGECITADGRVERRPGGARRYREVELELLQGEHTYKIAVERDARNTRANAIAMPSYIGDVYPLRYCEIDNPSNVSIKELCTERINYPFDDYASRFCSADTLLNAIWDFCKYSIKATSFTGSYVDGDRERIPYEADVYINQMCHYGVDSEYSIGRKTNEYLIFNPTWPTEWILSCVLLAWNDYLYSGNSDFIEYYFNELEAKCLTTLLDDNGLISTRTGKLTDEVKRSVHYAKRETLRDIVDWPHKGTLGLSGDDSGETDGFDFSDYNCVVNAYFNKALRVMSEMATAVGKEDKSIYYSELATKHYKAFNALFFDKTKGYYIDGITSSHSSLHSNMFALAFELVPPKHIVSVTEFVKSRGMACSVYGSQHLLDAVYSGEDGDYGMELLSSRGDRGWYHAIYNIGTTITLEAWDNKYKPNQDWNHAWGAAPANIIPMRLMGIQPLAAGFEKVRIKPQLSSLEWATLTYPTIRGDIELSFTNRDGSFTMEVVIPANMEAEVWVPSTPKSSVTINGSKAKAKRSGNFLVIDTLGSGSYSVVSEE